MKVIHIKQQSCIIFVAHNPSLKKLGAAHRNIFRETLYSSVVKIIQSLWGTQGNKGTAAWGIHITQY